MTRAEITRFLTIATMNKLMKRGRVFREIALGSWNHEGGILDLLWFKGLTISPSESFRLVGVEIKSCKQDFESDEHWPRYLATNLLDEFCFVTVEGAITLDDLQPSRIGKMMTKTDGVWNHLYARNLVNHDEKGWFPNQDWLYETVSCIGLHVYSEKSLEKIKVQLSRPYYTRKYPRCRILREPKPLQKRPYGYNAWKDERNIWILKRCLDRGSRAVKKIFEKEL
ncbi:hypothetical protein ES703_36819 [subsurface metagenome]